jgi:hypothetical protein
MQINPCTERSGETYENYEKDSCWRFCGKRWNGFLTQSAWALLPIEHWTQPSGAQVWLVQSPGIPMVDVQVDFDAGSRRDPEDKVGLATAVAMMSSKGVKAAGDAPALDENGLGRPGPTWAPALAPARGATASAMACAR